MLMLGLSKHFLLFTLFTDTQAVLGYRKLRSVSDKVQNMWQLVRGLQSADRTELVCASQSADRAELVCGSR